MTAGEEFTSRHKVNRALPGFRIFCVGVQIFDPALIGRCEQLGSLSESYAFEGDLLLKICYKNPSYFFQL